MDSILGRRSVNAKPIKDERLRVTLAIFVAKTRLGWTVPNRHHRVRSPIDAQESLERLDAKIARLAPDFKAGETRIRRTIGNATLPASISKRRPRWAAVWSRRHGSSAIARTNYLRASTASCRAGTPTKPPSSAISASARPGGYATRRFICWASYASGSNFPRSSARCASSRTSTTPTEILIEDKASGTRLIQELIADGCHGVTRYQPTTDKIMRMHAQTAMIENGFVHIPETAPWLAGYLHEMTVFPNGKHDGQVDSTAQFLDWFNKPFPRPNVFELYQREAES